MKRYQIVEKVKSPKRSQKGLTQMIDPMMLAVYPVSHEVPPGVLFDAESQIDLGVFVKLIPQGRRATLWR